MPAATTRVRVAATAPSSDFFGLIDCASGRFPQIEPNANAAVS